MQAMLYLLLIPGLLAAVALAVDKSLADLRVARRGIWFAALALSTVWPLAAVLSGEQRAEQQVETVQRLTQESPIAASVPSQASVAASREQAGGYEAEGVSVRTRLARALRFPFGAPAGSVDATFAGIWIASSTSVLLFYLYSAARLIVSARRWPLARLDDSDVRVSDRFGPAMFGLLRPTIVVPEWLLQSSQGVRNLVLRHEREHIAAGDHWMLATALGLLAVMPWNPVLWWQLRQLRFAMETDCDLRVVRHGGDPVAYARALLVVGQHRSVAPVASVALTTSPSRLESRVRRMLEPESTRRTVVIAASALASMLLTAAVAIEAPQLKFDRAPVGQSNTNGEDDMKVTGLAAAALLAASAPVAAQWDIDTTIPEGWEKMQGNAQLAPRLCQVGVNAAPRDGTATVKCEHADPIPGFGGLMQRIPADPYRGKRIRYSASLRSVAIRDPEPSAVSNGAFASPSDAPSRLLATRFFDSSQYPSVGSLFLRLVDGATVLAAERAEDIGLHGNNSWIRKEIVVDVPEKANWLLIGFWMQGKGQVWMTDVQVEEVGPNVPVTTPTIPYGPGVRNPTFQ